MFYVDVQKHLPVKIKLQSETDITILFRNTFPFKVLFSLPTEPRADHIQNFEQNKLHSKITINVYNLNKKKTI